MNDDLAPDDLAADLAATLADADQSPGLDPADAAAGWRVKDRTDDEPEPAAADAEPPADADDLRADLKAELDRDAGPPEKDDADAAAAWAKEQRALADAAIAATGIDLEKRHEHGLSRRETVRRLFSAERAIREDPHTALPTIVHDYAAKLDQGARERIATGVLQALGFDQVSGGLPAAERKRLAAYDAHARTIHEENQIANQQATKQLGEFAQTKDAHGALKYPHYEALRGNMAGFMKSGHARTLDEAYTMAARGAGINESAAEAADAARRSKVAAAKSAGTPQTRSAAGRTAEASRDQSLRDDLKDALREQAAEV